MSAILVFWTASELFCLIFRWNSWKPQELLAIIRHFERILTFLVFSLAYERNNHLCLYLLVINGYLTQKFRKQRAAQDKKIREKSNGTDTHKTISQQPTTKELWFAIIRIRTGRMIVNVPHALRFVSIPYHFSAQ